uniref:Uncharacterized protein n=1 Tax=Strigamia maritima TaxID=126957 RepID=T1IZF8_STRMM
MKSLAAFILSLFFYPGLFAQQKFQQEFFQEDFSARPLSQEQVAQQQFAAQQRQQSFLPKTTPAPVPLIIKQINSANEDGSYTFGYESQDGSYRVETKGTDGLTRGKYGYIDAGGVLREVEYSAGGQFGYEPSGSHIQVPPRPPPKKPGDDDEEYDDQGNLINQRQQFQSFANPSASFGRDTSQFINHRPQQVSAPAVRPQSVQPLAAPQPQRQSVRFPLTQRQPLPQQRDFTFDAAQAQIQPILQQQQQQQQQPLSRGREFNFNDAQTQIQPIPVAPRQRQPEVQVRFVDDAPIAEPAPSFQVQRQPATFQNNQQQSPLTAFLSQLQQNQRQF